MRRLGGKPGLPKSAVLPTIILKDEDINRLQSWEHQQSVPIHIWHVFYDLAFGVSLTRARELIANGLIEPTVQTFQAPGGAVDRKQIYKIYHHYGYSVGSVEVEPSLVAASLKDRNGHILPYVRFEGGSLSMSDEALDVMGPLA